MAVMPIASYADGRKKKTDRPFDADDAMTRSMPGPQEGLKEPNAIFDILSKVVGPGAAEALLATSDAAQLVVPLLGAILPGRGDPQHLLRIFQKYYPELTRRYRDRDVVVDRIPFGREHAETKGDYTAPPPTEFRSPESPDIPGRVRINSESNASRTDSRSEMETLIHELGHDLVERKPSIAGPLGVQSARERLNRGTAAKHWPDILGYEAGQQGEEAVVRAMAEKLARERGFPTTGQTSYHIPVEYNGPIPPRKETSGPIIGRAEAREQHPFHETISELPGLLNSEIRAVPNVTPEPDPETIRQIRQGMMGQGQQEAVFRDGRWQPAVPEEPRMPEGMFDVFSAEGFSPDDIVTIFDRLNYRTSPPDMDSMRTFLSERVSNRASGAQSPRLPPPREPDRIDFEDQIRDEAERWPEDPSTLSRLLQEYTTEEGNSTGELDSNLVNYLYNMLRRAREGGMPPIGGGSGPVERSPFWTRQDGPAMTTSSGQRIEMSVQDQLNQLLGHNEMAGPPPDMSPIRPELWRLLGDAQEQHSPSIDYDAILREFE